jgi:hypothetical protein
MGERKRESERERERETMRHREDDTYCRGRLSTIGPFNPTGIFLLSNNTGYAIEEANCIRPFPFVSIPCIDR